MNQPTNTKETPSFLEFCVLIMVKHLPGPTFNELLEHSDAYGLNEAEVKAGLVPLLKNKLIEPWPIYYSYSTFPFTGFTITNEGMSSFSLNNIESRNILMEATGWLSAVFAKASRTSHKIKVRKMLEGIYATKFHKKPIVKNLKKNSRKVKDPLFAAKIYSIIACYKLRTKNYSEAAHYYGSAAICFLRLKDKDHAKKCYFLAGKYFRRVRNVYSSLDCYYGAINFSKDVKEKQNLINQLPLPKEIIAKINPRNFKKDYWKVDKELESFIEKLLKITPTRTGGFLATLTNRFEEYFEEVINLNEGGKLMITSRIFYHMIEAFQVLIPKSNLPEFEDYEISEKLEMSHRVGGFYYHVGEFFVEGYLPSKNVKDALLETYDTINSAVVRPFVFIFDGMVTGGKKYDIGTKYEVLAWKNSDLAKHLQKNINLVFEDIKKEKKIKEMVGRRGCKIKEKSAQGKRIEKITKDYSNTYKKIFSICERESLFKILLTLRIKTASKSELNNLGLGYREIDLLVDLGVLAISDNILTFNEPFEQFWISGDWLPAYLLLLLENESKIEFEFCVHIEDGNGASHEIDLIIGNKKNTIGLVECKTSQREIGMNEIKKFFSAINMLEPIKYKYFFGYPIIEFNAERYSISKGIDTIGVKEITKIKKILSGIVSEIIKDV